MHLTPTTKMKCNVSKSMENKSLVFISARWSHSHSISISHQFHGEKASDFRLSQELNPSLTQRLHHRLCIIISCGTLKGEIFAHFEQRAWFDDWKVNRWEKDGLATRAFVIAQQRVFIERCFLPFSLLCHYTFYMRKPSFVIFVSFSSACLRLHSSSCVDCVECVRFRASTRTTMAGCQFTNASVPFCSRIIV